MTGVGPLVNVRTRHVIAATTELAADRRSRRRGLLGRTRLADGTGLLLVPCCAIHTWFMRFPIDVAFLDRTGRVVKACAGVRPWTMRICTGAKAVVELPAGTLAGSQTAVGDRLDFA